MVGTNTLWEAVPWTVRGGGAFAAEGLADAQVWTDVRGLES
ncbi:hypothetical protein [Streptomyces sp. NPDC047009]